MYQRWQLSTSVGTISWTSVLCLNLEPLGTRGWWIELPDSLGCNFRLSPLLNPILNPTSHQWSVISNPHKFFKYVISLEKISLCSWCFIISFNFHTIMKTLMSLFNFIWKCKSIVTFLTLISKYPLHFFVFISSLPSLQFYWAIWPFLAKRYFFGGRSYKFIGTGHFRTNVCLHPHLFHVLFLCIALSKGVLAMDL